MTDTIQWTPYVDKLMDHLGMLSLNRMTEWQGKDISPASTLDQDGIKGGCHAYSADNARKIAIGSFMVHDATQYGLCTIFPAPGQRLPIFLSRWEEQADEVVFLVDFIPTVDFLVDEDYRKTFLEPMGEHWERFGNLPGTCPEENDAVRSVCSIIYNAARVPIEREGMRMAALAPHTKYLEQYIEFLKTAAPAEEEKKQKEIQRKVTSVKNILGENFQQHMESIAGCDTAQLLRTIFF